MSNRSVTQIYRDCLRLIRHTSAGSRKGMIVQSMVRAQFDLSKNETDPKIIEQKKGDAIRALSNYLTMESLSRLRNTENDK